MTNNTAAAAQTTTVFETGDIVWGRPVVEGKTLARRKGIVLGLFNPDTSADQLIVWWYSAGEASGTASTLMFRRELTKAGDIFGAFGARKAKALSNGCASYSRATSLCRMLARHAVRMRQAGRL